MPPKALSESVDMEGILDGVYYASWHHPNGVMRLGITNPNYPSLANACLEILTVDGDTAAVWCNKPSMETSLADFLELTARRLRQIAGNEEIKL